MAAIKSRDTRPELQIRNALHRLGFRYKLHDKSLPGRPDLVFPRYRAVVFINGCFWHLHDCNMFRWPGTRQEFWQAKLGRNAENDARNLALLSDMGWRTATVWECALKGRNRLADQKAVQLLDEWLRCGNDSINIRGDDLG